MSVNKLRFNTYSCKPVVIITPCIHKVIKCIYCGNELSEFTDIEFYNQHERDFIHGKACIDCDIIYASDKIPKGVINGINSKFGKDILIEYRNLIANNKEYKNESSRIQKLFNSKNKTILQTSRSKPRSM